MKILIFASPRSGSTALTHAINQLLNIPMILEPYNILNIRGKSKEEIANLQNNLPSKCIVKVLSKHKTRKFFAKYIKLFDKVIFLTRKDIKLSIESYFYADEREEVNEQEFPGGTKWHLSYSFDSTNVSINQWVTDYITYSIQEVKSVAKLNKKSYIVYEDLYSKDLKVFNQTVDSLGLSIDKKKLREMIHPSKKYRKEVKPKTII